MTTRLDQLNAADELPEEAPRPPEPAVIKPSAPVIPQPAESNPSKLQAAIAAAAERKQAVTARVQAEREKLEEALSNSEPPRDELQSLADEMLSVSVKGPEAAALAKTLAEQIAMRQEMIRNLRQTAGVVIPEIENIGANVEDQLAAVIGANCAMREIIREICASAGTVRIDEVLPLKTTNGRVILQRRWADVGDEEPDQDPIVDLKWILPAGIKVAARFRRLMGEHANKVKEAAEAQHALTKAQERLRELETKQRQDSEYIRQLEASVKSHKPPMRGSPTGYYLRSEDGRWVARYEGKHECFVTKWRTVADQRDAYAFEFKETAQETLARLQFARLHRIDKRVRETLCVVAVRYEDHSAPAWGEV